MATLVAPSPTRLEKVFEPYARAVGKLVASWNQLQERLGELFSAIVTKENPEIGFAIWHAAQNDRTQREMLKAAARAATEKALLTDQMGADIRWLLGRADEFANKRNDAIHAPVAFFTDQNDTHLMTEYIYGNPRAHHLKGKNLVDEFSWCERNVTELSGYALRCAFWLRNRSLPWGERPKLPNRGEKAK
jgi:hypothetical protein